MILSQNSKVEKKGRKESKKEYKKDIKEADYRFLKHAVNQSKSVLMKVRRANLL